MTFLPRQPKPEDGDDATPQGAVGALLDRFANAMKSTPGAEGALLRAAEKGDVEAIRAQLAAGVSPDCVNASGESALHLAARKNQAEAVVVLLQAGAAIRAGIGEEVQRTPLMEAVNFGAEAAAAALIRHGAYVPEGPDAKTTLLHRAAEKGKVEIMQALMEAGADPLFANATGTSPLMAAIHAKQNAAIAVLLQRHDVAQAVNRRLDPGDINTIFHTAIMRGDAAMVDLMIAAGAFVNRPRLDGTTPLMLAITRGDAAMTALLLARGADPHLQTLGPAPQYIRLKSSPLVYLCSISNMAEAPRTEMIRQLLAYGVDVNASDAPGEDAPLHALLRGHNIYSALGVMLAAGAQIDRPNRAGDTPLMLSISRASVHEMTNLLSAGADPNARRAADGCTALMLAAAAGQTERITELLHAGADVRATDHAGQSVLDHARTNTRMASLTVPVIEKALAQPPRAPRPKPGPGRG